MGIHLLNPNLLDDKIDADKPELLVYERRNDGSMKLVALEYLIFQALSNGRPSLFGQPFDEIKADNRYGIPASWALHAWIWKPNPSGMLYAWNPRVELQAPARGREPRVAPGQTGGGLRQRQGYASQSSARPVGVAFEAAYVDDRDGERRRQGEQPLVRRPGEVAHAAEVLGEAQL